MTRRLFNRKYIRAICGPGADYIEVPRYEWPRRHQWPNRPERRLKLVFVPYKKWGAMNEYCKV